MNQKMLLGVFAVAVLAVGSVAAFGMGPGFGFGDEDHEAFHDRAMAALESGDYDTWKALHEERLSEEQFQAMQEHHEQMQETFELREQLREAYEAGDTELANNLKAQLQDTRSEGFGYGMGPRGGDFGRHGMMGGCPFADAE